MRRRHLKFCLAFIAAAILLLPVICLAEDTTAGRKVYEKYCIGCHGEKGDGNGIAAKNLIIRPRDLTSGVFKFKSSPAGTLPSADDLKKIITYGLPTSSMPSFRLMPDVEMDAVIKYIMTLSERWKMEESGEPIGPVSAPEFVGTPGSINKGKQLYSERCAMCHGEENEVSSVSFTLRWGAEQCKDLARPANFNNRIIKRGSRVEDIYRSIILGVEGTPMLSFKNLLSDEDRWHLTSYILKIMGKERR